MPHKLLEQLFERGEIDKQDSDFAYFWMLLLTGEAVAKTIVLGMLAAINDDTQRNRYRLEYKLVRANGLGEWSDAIEDVLNGPSSQYLIGEAQPEREQLTKLCTQGDWQYGAVSSLKKVLDKLRINAEAVPTRTDMKRWFRLFVTLRNKTRGHGATRPAETSEVASCLCESINLIYRNFGLFQRSWVYLYRNLSGKYRVTRLGENAEEFDFLKRESRHSYPNGVYVHFASPKLIPLLVSDPELRDFFLPNGGFSDKSFDLLSYATDDKQSGDSSTYLVQPDIQVSETHGHGELLPKGKCFSNAPDSAKDYVRRRLLENELFALLMDDRHPVITLQGAGGVGKTSSTLQVIEKLYKENRFEMIVWFSARDIDLLFRGPRTVRPGVLSPDDIAELYAALVRPDKELKNERFDRKDYFQKQLGKCDGGKCLFVFDNFETMQNPVEMFTWIERFVRLPNKILITTRLRDFKGDYPLEVHGMTDQEARTLIQQTASYLNIVGLITHDNINEVINQSGGHPYVIKMFLGEVANTKRFRSLRRVVAGSDEILTALFERTFEALSPCGQRAFMTLAAWNSAVPRVALEAVLIRSTEERSEVEKGIESLLHYSLAEIRITSNDNQEFISLPLAASEFGKKQLQTNVLKSAIQSDVQILQMFNPSSISDVNLNLQKGLERFVRNLSDQIDKGYKFADYEPILSMVCRAYNPGWLLLAQWHLERGTPRDVETAISDIEAFLQRDPMGSYSANAWQMLARAYYRKQDPLREIHAYVERAQFDSVPFHDVSNTASFLNRKYRELDLEVDGKRELAQRLLGVLEARISEAKPDDLSRMAWLALHLSQDAKASNFVRQGLQVEPENAHCLKIAERLDIVV